MTSSEYWKKREADALKSYQKDEEAYYEEIQEIYADMMERIQKEIDSFYIKYAAKEDISMAEAKREFRSWISKLMPERQKNMSETVTSPMRPTRRCVFTM